MKITNRDQSHQSERFKRDFTKYRHLYIDTPEKRDGVLRRSEAKEKDMFLSGDLT
jgi:hypothetical protein